MARSRFLAFTPHESRRLYSATVIAPDPTRVMALRAWGGLEIDGPVLAVETKTQSAPRMLARS